MIIINRSINSQIQHAVYYLALCFMNANGIANPFDHETDLNDAVRRLRGERPGRSAQAYRAAYLHRLVRHITAEFQKVHQGLATSGFRNLQSLDFHHGNEISMDESLFRIEPRP